MCCTPFTTFHSIPEHSHFKTTSKGLQGSLLLQGSKPTSDTLQEPLQHTLKGDTVKSKVWAQKNYLQMYFGHFYCWRNQSQIAWNLVEQYKGICKIGAEYGNYLYMRGDSIQIKLVFVVTKLLFSCLFSSALTIHLTNCRGSSLVYVFTFPLTSLRILFTWIILLNERGLLMHKVIFMFRPLLDQPIWDKRN